MPALKTWVGHEEVTLVTRPVTTPVFSVTTPETAVTGPNDETHVLNRSTEPAKNALLDARSGTSKDMMLNKWKSPHSTNAPNRPM